MKKLRLNKLFHWLYAILMLWPFINFVFTFPMFWFTGYDRSFWVDDIGLGLNQFFTEYVPNFSDSSLIAQSIFNVWDYLARDILGIFETDYFPYVVNFLTYWTCVSLVYLVFDVVMYPINLFHKWIDDGGF